VQEKDSLVLPWQEAKRKQDNRKEEQVKKIRIDGLLKSQNEFITA